MAHSTGFLGLLISLATIGSLLVANVESTRVNLLNPAFISAEVIECKPLNGAGDERNCSLNLWTRAAQYQINNILTSRVSANGTTVRPVITRVGGWLEPGLVKDESGFFYGNYSKMTGQRLVDDFDQHLKKETQLKTDKYYIMNNTGLYPYIRCEAKAYVKNGSFYCARDVFIGKCSSNGSGRDLACIIGRREHRFPVSSLAIETISPLKDFAFELSNIGYLSVYEIESATGGISLNVNLKRRYMLSALGSSMDQYLKRPDTILVDDSLVVANPKISRTAMRMMGERLDYTYLMAVTPIGQEYTANDYNKPIDVLRFTNGFQGHLSRAELYTQRGMGLNRTRDDPEPSSPSNRATINEFHAMSQYTYEGNTVLHAFMTVHEPRGLEKKAETRYYHGVRPINGTTTTTTTTTNTTLRLVKKRQVDARLVEMARRGFSADVDIVPNDLVPFYDPANKCAKHIVFYSVVYQVYDLGEPLINIKPVKYEPRFNFYIQAAYSHNGMFYFFTGTNTVITIPAKMSDAKCESVVFDFASAKESTALKYFADTFGWTLNETFPPLTDYQELAEGESDTKPALLVGEPDVQEEPEKKPEKKGGFNVIIVSIALVVGGLILAAIIYVCFVMSGSAAATSAGRRPKAKSRRSKAREVDAAASSEDNLRAMKTQRSHIQSVPGSKIQSPAKRPKSKRAAKSIAHAIKSKKSKLSASRKSPTSLTTVKVSHGEPIPVHREQVPGSAASAATATSASSAASSTTKSPSAIAQKSTSSAARLTPRSPRSPSTQGSSDGNARSPSKSPQRKSRASSSEVPKSPRK